MGNGNHINAFSDCWIPKLASGRSSPCGLNEAVMVKDLISLDREWKVDVVMELFPAFEAEYILDIPLSRHFLEDIRFWRWGLTGKYSVKSGYLLQLGCFTPPDTQSANHMEKWWNMIWSLNIHQKIRIFYWRACNGSFPSDLNLFKRHVTLNAVCSFCGSVEASTEHCLIFCPKAREAWEGTYFWFLLKQCICMDFISCGLVMKDKVSKAEFELFVIYLWAIWKDLCSMKHNSKPRNFKISLQWAASFLDEFRRVRSSIDSHVCYQNYIKVHKWFKPPMGQFRLDVDACYQYHLGRCSVGAVIRDHLGRICAASACGIRDPGSVLAAELSVILHGILLVSHSDFNNVLVFSDSVNAVQRINSSSESLSAEGSIILDILEFIKLGKVTKICYSCRNANKVAHELAQFALSNPLPVCWGDNFYPSWLMDVAASDLSNV